MSKITISQLDEKEQILETDSLLIEDNDKTYKVSVEKLTKTINTNIDKEIKEFETKVNKIDEFETKVNKIDEVETKVNKIDEVNTGIKSIKDKLEEISDKTKIDLTEIIDKCNSLITK